MSISTVSVIIPVSSNSEELPILSSLKDVDYPEDRLEIILSIGKLPSVQRNHAAGIAKGDILYFLNRDAQLESDVVKQVTSIFNSDAKIAGVGGPDLTPSGNSYLQHLFGYAMSSYFAHWKMRARYLQVGKERVSDEKELLLSNLAIRRDIYLKANGFNEGLYPNEENELINRISKMGYKFIYSSEIKIYRDRRRTLFTFAKQFYRYGKGRMRQIFIEGYLKNSQFFMPVLLFVYFLILPFVKELWFAYAPLFIYITLGIIDVLYLSFKNKRILTFPLPMIYLIMHLSYGIGMLTALVLRFKAKHYKKEILTQEIIIKKVNGDKSKNL